MKYVFVIFALYLLVSTSALTAKSRAAAEAANKAALASLRRVHNTKLGKTLIDTIQIELRSNTKVDPRPRIRQLLQEILDDTQEALVNLGLNNANSRNNCQVNQAELELSIADLEKKVATDGNEHTSVQGDLTTQTSQRGGAASLKETYQGQLAVIQSDRLGRKNQYDKTNERLTRIRSALEQTRGFITDRIQDRSNPSFLQRNNVLVEIKKKVMSPDFQAASAGWGKFISFLATKALNKIRETPDDEASEGLSSIVNVINDVIDTLNQEITANNNAEDSDRISTEDAVRRLQTSIDTTSAQIAVIDLNIAHDQGRLNELDQAIKTNNEILDNNQADLSANKLSCQQADDEYSALFAQRNQEVEIIQEVLNLLNTSLANLRSLTENVVNSAVVEEYY